MKRRTKCICIAVLAVLFLFCMAGCGHTARMSRNGSGSAEIYIDKNAYSEQYADVPAFTSYVSQVIYNFNVSSGDDDILSLDSVSETQDSYIVGVSYRRVDNVKGLGDFTWSDLSVAGKEGSELNGRLGSFSRGNLRCTLERNYDGDVGTVGIEAGTLKNQKYITPVAADGTALEIENFLSAAAGSGDKIVVFRLLDTRAIQKIRFNLQGTVTYYSSEGVNLVSESEIELVPSDYVVNLTKYEAATDENGSPLLDESGNPVKTAVYYPDETVGCMIGYFAFRQSVSPVLIGLIAVIAAALAAFLVWGFAGGKFKKFFRGEKFRTIKAHKLLYAMLVPGLVFLIIFAYMPMFGLVSAFQEYRLTEGFFNSEFVGFKHFIHLFSGEDETIYRVFRNTIYISVIRIGTNFPMILLFALLLNSIRNRYVKGAVQTMSYMPNFVSWVAIGGMMYGLFSVDYGAINKLLVSMGASPVHWYAESQYWWWILALTSLWKSMGWGTIIYMSALGSIDSELYDACMIDGGGGFRKTTTVTLPGIMNVVMLQLIMDAGNVMKDNYEQILAVSSDSPGLGDTITVIGSITFNAALSGTGLSVSTALGLVQGVIGLILVLLVNNVAKKTGNEGIM